MFAIIVKGPAKRSIFIQAKVPQRRPNPHKRRKVEVALDGQVNRQLMQQLNKVDRPINSGNAVGGANPQGIVIREGDLQPEDILAISN